MPDAVARAAAFTEVDGNTGAGSFQRRMLDINVTSIPEDRRESP
jgi:hypothetical protein